MSRGRARFIPLFFESVHRNPSLLQIPVTILIPEDRIRDRVGELAAEIERDYANSELTIVAILTGSLILLADLIRRIHLPLRVDLLQASSYKGATVTSGELIVNDAFKPVVAGRDVLLLDDILDTGKTLVEVVRVVSGLGARSVKTAVLLRKLGRQVATIEPDYFGFEIPNAFVVGYGLDYNDDYRHLPYIAVLDDPPDSGAGGSSPQGME